MKLVKTEIFPMTDSVDFEHLCADLYRRIWRDPDAKLHGTSGQNQQGVDIYGQPEDSDGDYFGVQCKVKDRTRRARLTQAEIVTEVAKAERFLPPLKRFIVATTDRRDAKMQCFIRELSRQRETEGKFTVDIHTWDDLLVELENHDDLIEKHLFQTRSVSLVLHERTNVSVIHAARDLSSSTIPSLRAVTERLNVVLQLLKVSAFESKISISRIAEIMHSEKFSSIARFFDGTVEPSIQFLYDFATRFGVSADWLLHGEGNPFYLELPFITRPDAALEFIRSSTPEKFYFVRSLSQFGECAIVLRYNQWRFHTIPHMWHVSGHVGGGGASDLVALNEMVIAVRNDPASQCFGQVLDSEKFEQLICGDLFPGSVLELPHANADWWYALPDLEHLLPSAENYRVWYGQSFLDAQEVIRQTLSRSHHR